jgi:parallel beta-helix repeat protein
MQRVGSVPSLLHRVPSWRLISIDTFPTALRERRQFTFGVPTNADPLRDYPPSRPFSQGVTPCSHPSIHPSIRSALLASAFALLVLSVPARATVFCVSDAGGLQTALTTAATNGVDDEVQIVQGTYVGNFVYASTQANTLSVLGGYEAGCANRTLDPTNTVLDGNQTNTVLALSAPNVAASLLVEGLTLQNGKRTSGSGSGGGLYAKVGTGGTVAVERNHIEGNEASGTGGGIDVNASNVTLTNNTITDNLALYGGGAYVYANSNATITNNSIHGNTGPENGGGIYVVTYSSSTTIISNNSIQGNTGYSGGGILVVAYSSYVTITNNSIQGNTGYYGGGILCGGDSSFILTNNSIQGNTSYVGGGIYVETHYDVTLTNNTVTDNLALGGSGGGLWLRLNGGETTTSAVLYNNLFWNNQAPDNVGADLWIENDPNSDYLPVPVTLLANNFDQTQPTGFAITIPIAIAPSNLNAIDPLFVDAANGDLHLSTGSPMIDAGYLDTPDIPDTDLDGNPRVVNGVVDIGAYEFDGSASDPLSATVTISNITYDGNTTATITGCTLSGVVSPDVVSCDYSSASADFADANVGTDKPVNITGLVLSGNDADKYKLPSKATSAANIAKATATVVLGNLNQTYTGGPLMPTATTTPTGLAVTWTGAPQTNAGLYSVTATVNDQNYSGSETGLLTIAKATPSVIAWPTASPIAYGQTLASSILSGGSSIPSGTFAFTAPTTAPGVGTAAQSVTFTPGSTTNYEGVTGSVNVTVDKADQADLTVIATPGSIVSPGSSTLSASGGSGSGAVTYAANATPGTTCSISGSTLTATGGAGSCSVIAIKDADTNYNSISSPPITVSVTVSATKVDTTTTLSSSLNPSGSGQAVTFTVVVTGNDPTGTVTIKDGSTTLATGTLSNIQHAMFTEGLSFSFTTSTLGIGTHSLTASYGGDANNTGSSSAVLSQVVKAASTTTLVSSLNPSTVGRAVTFTATVKGTNPTGTVNFYDGNVSLGTATISRGTAKLSTSQLSAGTHSITAIYGSNATNAGSESGTLAQVVKVASSTAISSSLNPSARGQSVTFTATVNGNNPTGSVTFRDGIRSLGAVTLSGGTATYSSGTLAKGTHSITATYAGDSLNVTSTSSKLIQTVR